MFGLLKSDIEYIINVAKKHDSIKSLGIYGSRSRGDFKATSDIDIVIYGKEIDFITINELVEELEENSPYPYFVDIKHYDKITDEVFKNEVDRDVKIIYVV